MLNFTEELHMRQYMMCVWNKIFLLGNKLKFSKHFYMYVPLLLHLEISVMHPMWVIIPKI